MDLNQNIIHNTIIQLIFECCQYNISNNSVAKELENFSIDDFIKTTKKHGVLPIVYKNLQQYSKNFDTPFLNTLLNELKKEYFIISRKNILMTAQLIQIIQLFKKNNIHAYAFKGPTLAQMAYGNITLRQYSDIDILVNEKDVLKAGKLMSKHSHLPVLPLTILSNQICIHTAKDFSFISKGGVHTELHWRLFEKKYNISLLNNPQIEEYQKITINGHYIETLPNELLLVYLCLHGAKHTFERIEWICDIDRVVRTHDIEWNTAISLANQSHSKRSFYLGLSLSHRLFHTPIPKNIIPYIENKTIKMLHTLVLSKMVQQKAKVKSNFKKNRETFSFQSQLFDSKLDMLYFKISTFFKISINDCQTFILPEKLKFFYLFLRPLRIISNYFKSFS